MFERVASVYSEIPAVAMRGAQADVCIGLETGIDHEHVILKDGTVLFFEGKPAPPTLPCQRVAQPGRSI